MARALAIIPARLGSTRLPGKVLLDRTGTPLIQHVWENARRATCLSRIVVATDDERVAAAVRGFGGECVMTSPAHPNGTSRLHEACERLGIAESPGDEVIVNVQGDEPDLEPALIETGVRALLDAPRGVDAATVAVPFGPGEDPASPSIVKVVRRLDGTAMYFSRAMIPFDRDGAAGAEARPLRHLGLYIYRRRFLARYVRLASTPLEQAEKLEQLRVLEHGLPMAVAVATPTNPVAAGIDTPEQYEAFVRTFGGRRG
jgi:3-deoxy-manno-octulosonate cytidylyltransferase (CMP-KDO synthetase)